MRNVAAFLYGQVLLWCVRRILPAAPVGVFVATHTVWVSPRSRQEETTKRWRAKPPTMSPPVHPSLPERMPARRRPRTVCGY